MREKQSNEAGNDLWDMGTPSSIPHAYASSDTRMSDNGEQERAFPNENPTENARHKRLGTENRSKSNK